VQVLLIPVLTILHYFVSIDGIDCLALFVQHLAGRVQVDVEGQGFGGGVVVLLEVEVYVFAGGLGGVGAAILVI